MRSSILKRTLVDLMTGTADDFQALVDLVRAEQIARNTERRMIAKAALRVGGKATFTDRSGVKRTMVVTKICSKNVQGYEIRGEGQRVNWRVSATLLTAV